MTPPVRRIVGSAAIILGAFGLVAPRVADAQPAGKVARIGVLSSFSPSGAAQWHEAPVRGAKRQNRLRRCSVVREGGSAENGLYVSCALRSDLRQWITRVEAIGQLRRITAEVERDEEMGAITYMAHQELGAPALHFERIRGCPRGSAPSGTSSARAPIGSRSPSASRPAFRSWS